MFLHLLVCDLILYLIKIKAFLNSIKSYSNQCFPFQHLRQHLSPFWLWSLIQAIPSVTNSILLLVHIKIIKWTWHNSHYDGTKLLTTLLGHFPSSLTNRENDKQSKKWQSGMSLQWKNQRNTSMLPFPPTTTNTIGPCPTIAQASMVSQQYKPLSYMTVTENSTLLSAITYVLNMWWYRQTRVGHFALLELEDCLVRSYWD